MPCAAYRRTVPTLVAFCVAAILGVACGSDAAATPSPDPTATSPPTPTPTPHAAPTPTRDHHSDGGEEHGDEDGHDEVSADEGKRIFRTVGCSSCHGEEAEGMGDAPPLAGHTPEQVRRQVRDPRGVMPRFSEDDLSEEELEHVIAYIQSLEGEGHEHGHHHEQDADESTG